MMSPRVMWTPLVLPCVSQNGTFDDLVGPKEIRHVGPRVTLLYDDNCTMWAPER
jgi:hypothetical protein